MWYFIISIITFALIMYIITSIYEWNYEEYGDKFPIPYWAILLIFLGSFIPLIGQLLIPVLFVILAVAHNDYRFKPRFKITKTIINFLKRTV